MSESIFKRYKRYIRYSIQSFVERMKGLDFTMRDTSLIETSGGVLHGYSKTDESHAKKIFEMLNVDDTKNLLDVGCGKGAFLREACKYPFGKIAGLEYVESLAKIAEINFKKLKLDNRISIFQGDAIIFDKYKNYNVFYFFNPFDQDIMDKVMKKIVESRTQDFWVILHNPIASKNVEKYGCIEENRLFDPVKSYETIIYKWEYKI